MSATTPARILNVDDTEVARYAKGRTLRHAGFEVVDAATAAQALALLERERFALALLDVRLPDMSGIDLCRAIKERRPTVLVLQTSATFTSADDRARGLEGGADSYLIQPIDPGELVAAVRALLRLQAAEEATRQLNETLEQRIAERTQELNRANARLIEQIAQRERAEAALVQSQKMEAVGQLTGSMAHDFNNILGAMVGYVYLALRKNRQPEIATLLEKALAAAERGKRLTARLLAFAREDELTTGATDIVGVLEGMREWLGHSAGSSTQLVLQVPGHALAAVTDANQLELAILNLVINARDAMPEGGTIEVRAERRVVHAPTDDLAPGDYAVVSVRDDGVGMPPEVAQQAFKPFFTTKPKGRGTGLGLAQVAHLAATSGGGVRLTSVPGEGTTIEIWLPVADIEETIAAARRDAPAGERKGRGEYVLVVDDEADIRRTIATLLEEHGYVVRTADSGGEAIAITAQRPPDAVIVDFAMPGLNGVEVAERLRRTRPGLAVLFVSGHVDLELLEAAIPNAALLRKPFRPDELYVALRACIDAASGLAEVHGTSAVGGEG